MSMSTEYSYSKDDIKDSIKKYNVKRIRLEFIDVLGKVKAVEVPSYQIDKILNGQIMFDGSSIVGYTPIEKSDLYLKPDLSTWLRFPWTNDKHSLQPNLDSDTQTARLICDVYKTDGTPFMNDPRNVLKHELKQLNQFGKDTEFDVGLEPEFFLLPRNKNGQPILKPVDNISYFDISNNDITAECRNEISSTLIKMGLHIEAEHHEVAPGQCEIDFKYSDALNTADNIELFKYVAKTIAKKFNLYATFMPKPFNAVNGSGMHINQSLFSNGKNLFYDKNAKNGLSKIMKYYIAGLLHHAKGFTSLCDTTINSYKRLQPGFEAPVNIAWGLHNRTGLVRIPSDRGLGTRIELRSADLTSNPYLALTTVLASGLDGIKHKLTPPKPMEKNLFTMPANTKTRLGIKHLPSSLKQALVLTQHDNVIAHAIGDSLLNAYINAKNKEVTKYNSLVTSWEQHKYLDV